MGVRPMPMNIELGIITADARQVIERRNQLAARQVARCAKDDQDAGFALGDGVGVTRRTWSGFEDGAHASLRISFLP